jgi:cytochrome c oxidase assembly factor CtaG
MITLTFGNVITRWSFDPLVVIGVTLAAVLYHIGNQATQQLLPPGHRMGPRRWKSAMFYTSLVLVVLALESPLDYLSASLMWAHMIQHLVLIMLVAPLSLLGDPALPLLRGLPLAFRRKALARVTHWPPVQAIAAAITWLSQPVRASVSFAVTLYAWHSPSLYNLTLRNAAVHDLEHAMFLGVSILLWSQVIDQTQFRCRMGYGARCVYVVVSAAENHLLSVVLALATSPIYAYARLTSRPGNITALSDQQIAGGIMWVPGMFLYGTAFSIFLFKWLKEQTLPNGVTSRADLKPISRGTGPLPRSEVHAAVLDAAADSGALLGAK